MQSYVAWVPNIFGALSFSAIGTKGRAILSQYADDEEIVQLALFGRHTNKDPKFRFVRLFHTGFNFCYFITGCAEKSGSNRSPVLRGRIFIAQRGIGKRVEFRDRALFISTFARSILAPTRDIASLADRNQFLNDEISKIADYELSYSLSRTGKLELTVCEETGFPAYYRNGLTAGAVDCELLAKMGFNYIRQSVHTHKHHDPRDDKIVSIIPGSSLVGNARLAWRNTIADQMRSRLISLHNVPSYESCYRAQGVAAYLRAFEDIFDEHGIERDASEKVNLQNFSDSVEAKRQTGALALAWLGAVLTLVSTGFLGSRAFYQIFSEAEGVAFLATICLALILFALSRLVRRKMYDKSPVNDLFAVAPPWMVFAATVIALAVFVAGGTLVVWSVMRMVGF